MYRVSVALLNKLDYAWSRCATTENLGRRATTKHLAAKPERLVSDPVLGLDRLSLVV